MQKINILILNKEIRLSDNISFLKCIKKNNPFLIIYYDFYLERRPAEISFFWLLKSASFFQKDLSMLFNSEFRILYSSSEESLSEIINIISKEFQISEVFFNFSKLFLPRILIENNFLLNESSGNFIINYEALNREFKVFTPFYNFCMNEFVSSNSLEIFSFLKDEFDFELSNQIKQIQNNFLNQNQNFFSRFEKIIPSEYAKNQNIIGLFQDNYEFPDWWKKIEEKWNIGEKNALKKFELFSESFVEIYSEKRDFLSAEKDLFDEGALNLNHDYLSSYTSRLSPNIHFGEISVRFIFKKLFKKSISNKNIQTFLKQIFWREFAYNIFFFHKYDLHLKELRVDFFDNFEWNDPMEENKFEKWKRGQTGFPIIDAAMRQLWQTGWMHNRARMITASFLTKNLLIDWRLGEQWFFETLVDADEAVNPFSWQWVAGCGTDSSPYFRIFNPILQSQKFDSNGDYIKRFVKELDFISSNEKLYEPWKFYSNVKDFYFEPITDLLKSRQKALDNFHKIKNKKY